MLPFIVIVMVSIGFTPITFILIIRIMIICVWPELRDVATEVGLQQHMFRVRLVAAYCHTRPEGSNSPARATNF